MQNFKMLLVFIIVYILLAKISPRLELHSIVHCIVSICWNGYMMYSYIPTSMFSYNTVKNMLDFLQLNPEIKSKLILSSVHSIGYFLGDLIYIIVWQRRDRKYIFHHIISILSILVIYFDCYIPTYGIFFGQLGGLGHHVKRFENSFYFLKPFIVGFYFMIYSTSRILMLMNAIHYSFYLQKYVDIIPTYLSILLVIQNFIWLYKNYKKLSSK